MERTSARRIVTGHFSKVGEIVQFRTEEFAGDVESFATDYHDFLTVEELFGHDTGQATQEMSLAIDHNHWIEGRHLGSLHPLSPFFWMGMHRIFTSPHSFVVVVR